MPRIVGIDIPNHKRIPIALTYIHGIGRTTAEQICKRMGFPLDLRAKDLTDEQVAHVATLLDKEYMVEGALRRQVAQNIQRLKEIGCYRGIRHRRGLPVRGQQTQSNARTRKGPKKTVAGKKGVKAQK